MDIETDICRLCGGSAQRQFSRIILGRHTVAYFQCTACHSLQTQKPYWLESAYQHNLADLDTGAAQRNLTNLGATAMVAGMLRLRNIVDFGGGDGLLCRLLRDYGFNCFSADKYAQAVYAQGFTEPDFEQPDLVLAFEVLEHFADPAQDLAGLFSSKPAAIFVSTELFSGQDESWWYLTPETGQHVFFYSADAMHEIAKRFGYRYFRSGNYFLFIAERHPQDFPERVLRAMLNRLTIRLARTLLVAGPAPGRDRDFESLRKAGKVAPSLSRQGRQ